MKPRVRSVIGRPSKKVSGYSAASLLGAGLRKESDWPRVWRSHELKGTYDVVIIGGGIHGLATAYYLASRHGITNVAVLDKGYLGGGGSGRNTAIARSNYLTPEGVAFYDRSLKLYEGLSAELNFNIMFSQRGHMTLAHNDASLRTMRWRAEVNKLQGIDSEVITPEEIKKLRAAPGRVRPHALPGAGRSVPPPGRDHPARRGRVGLRPRRGPLRSRAAPADRGAGDRHRCLARSRPSRPTAATSAPRPC